MSKFRKRLTDNAGFTLIELLVVIAVLGILAGIAVPRLTGVTDRAKKSEAVSALSSLKTALEIEELETGSYPASITSVAAEYLDGTTSDGAAWEDWTIAWEGSAPTSDGAFTVKMTNPDGLEVKLMHDSSGEYTIED